MTIETLQTRFPSVPATAWRQHSNGGGWVHKDAYVREAAFVGPDAIIRGGRIYGGRITGGEIHGGRIFGGEIRGGEMYDGEMLGGGVYGGSIFGGRIYDGEIFGGCVYGGEIHGGTIYAGSVHGGIIFGGSIYGGQICGGEIHGGTIHAGTIRGGWIFNGDIRGGEILDGSWQKSPILIQGSRDLISEASRTLIRIGCRCESLDWWLKYGLEVARKAQYTKAQIEEYEGYLRLIETVRAKRAARQGKAR